MCTSNGGGGGLDLGVVKINFNDTIRTVGLGGAGLVYDALVGDPQKAAKNALDAQKDANKIAVASATKQADLADQANNRANGKQPDIGGMLSQNMLNAKGGQSGTMLTGSTGIDPSTLLLGKKTLLGS